MAAKTINTRVKLGEWQELRVIEASERGWLLDAGDAQVLLSKQEAVECAEALAGESMRVFAYLLNGGELAVTMQEPQIVVGECAALEVKEVTPVGAFLEWGLKKDLLLPFGEQQRRVEVGQKIVVRLYVDEKTQRLSATMKLGRFLPQTPRVFLEGEEIEIMIIRKTPLGFAVIAEGQRWGMIYDNQIYQRLEIGQTLRAYVLELRADGRLDIALQRTGQAHANDLSDQLLARMEAAGGSMPYSDTSSPEEIKREFNASKKAFKRALGQLYRQGKIELCHGSVSLKKAD